MNDVNPDLPEFASELFRLPQAQLPEEDEDLKRAVMAEAVRLALHDNSPPEGRWDPVHVLSLRNWAHRKVRGVIGDHQGEGSDLFTEVVDDPKKPDLTFLGDLLDLKEAYYAPAPTRAIMVDESTAALVSGLPTYCFSDLDSSIKVKGVSRLITETSSRELKSADIPIQEREDYIGVVEGGFGREFLEKLIQHRNRQAWEPRDGWLIYQGSADGYGFEWGRERGKEVVLTEGVVSLWKEQVEYGPDQYWLKLIGKDEGSDSQMLKVPARFFKYVCLNIDQLAENPHTVTFEKADEVVRVICDFAPPAPQMRWLHAIGAGFEGFQSADSGLTWVIETEQQEPTVRVFETLPVQIEEEA